MDFVERMFGGGSRGISEKPKTSRCIFLEPLIGFDTWLLHSWIADFLKGKKTIQTSPNQRRGAPRICAVTYDVFVAYQRSR